MGPMAISRVDPAQNEFLAGLEARGKHGEPVLPRHGAPAGGTQEFRAALRRGHGRRLRRTALQRTGLPHRLLRQRVRLLHRRPPARGKKAGITEDEMPRHQTERTTIFAAAERAAIAYARELTRTAAADDTRDALAEHFTDEQIVELTLVAAMANFTNRFNNGLASCRRDNRRPWS